MCPAQQSVALAGGILQIQRTLKSQSHSTQHSVAPSKCLGELGRNGVEVCTLPPVPESRPTRSIDPLECPGCKRTMRLVGREAASSTSELLTFECECGQIVTHTTNQ